MSCFKCYKESSITADPSILKPDMIEVLIHGYIHSTINVDTDDDIMNIIEKYVSKDFKILSGKDRWISKIVQTIATLKPFLEKYVMYMGCVYIIQPILSFMILLFGAFDLNDTDCVGFPINPILYVFIGSIIIITSALYKIAAIFASAFIEAHKMAARVLNTITIVWVLEYLFIFSWIILGIVMITNNKYICNSWSIIGYIIAESLLLLPGLMVHTYLTISIFENNHGYQS